MATKALVITQGQQQEAFEVGSKSPGYLLSGEFNSRLQFYGRYLELYRMVYSRTKIAVYSSLFKFKSPLSPFDMFLSFIFQVPRAPYSNDTKWASKRHSRDLRIAEEL